MKRKLSVTLFLALVMALVGLGIYFGTHRRQTGDRIETYVPALDTNSLPTESIYERSEPLTDIKGRFALHTDGVYGYEIGYPLDWYNFNTGVRGGFQMDSPPGARDRGYQILVTVLLKAEEEGATISDIVARTNITGLIEVYRTQTNSIKHHTVHEVTYRIKDENTKAWTVSAIPYLYLIKAPQNHPLGYVLIHVSKKDGGSEDLEYRVTDVIQSMISRLRFL